MSKRNRPQPNKTNYVIDSKTKIAGKTQSQLADDWAKYQLTTPQDHNFSRTGNGDFAGVNQSGDVYFLSGSAFTPSFNGTPTTETSSAINATIVVPQGKILYFPIINGGTTGNNITTEDGLYSDTSKDDNAATKEQLDNLKIFNITIDGKPVLDFSQAQNYRQKTQDPNGFSVTSTENSIYAGTLYDNAFLAKNYQEGLYLGLNPLPPGKHTVSFEAEMPAASTNPNRYPANKQSVSFTIDVKPFKEIKGDDKNNNLKGTWGNDNIDAFGGNDTVYGYGGDDIIDGWGGNDKIYGGDGKDIIYGGAGNDHLDGGCDDDVVAGGLGDDTIVGECGNDRLYGGSGKDKIDAGDGDDKVFGGLGSDTINGGKGNDVIDAVAYSPLVLPVVYLRDFTPAGKPGQGEIDTIKGGAGRDTFILGMASDTKVGVTGSQYYVGAKDKDYALIQDFELGRSGRRSSTPGDVIQLYGKADEYLLGAAPTGTPQGVGIFTKDTNDLIGILQGSGVSLFSVSLTNSSQFNFVS